MIGQPYNPDQCAFLLNQALNANLFNPNVPDASNNTNHIVLWNFIESKLLWVNTITNLIESEIGGIPTLQQVLDFNHDLVNGNNFQGTLAGVGNTGTQVLAHGSDAALGNTGSDVNAIGLSAARENIGNNINAIGGAAAYLNEGNNVNAFGTQAAQENTGTNVNAFGVQAAQENTGGEVNAFGSLAASINTGGGVNAFGIQAARRNTGTNVNAVGGGAARQNTGSNVIALGTNAGISNPLSGMFIISNSELPSYADHAAAVAAISPTGRPNNTYIYHNQGTMSIGAVRL